MKTSERDGCAVLNLDDFIDDLADESDFEEVPVDIDTFMGEGYLEQEGVVLSRYQKEMVEHISQIYRHKSLVELYGKYRADKMSKKTVREVIAVLGKGSGKDYISEIACLYVVYKLLCLKDPAKYFGKPPGDSFDIINVAINADQARNVFFKGLSRMVRNSPWFAGKFTPRQRDIAFDKNITIYSGHSEAEAFEGYNLFMCVLDEIAGFEHYSGEGDEDKSPAQAIYDMYSASITSRFGNVGKLVLLSFPRAKGDFITTRYEDVVAEVNKIPKSHTFVINPELSPDAPGNSFDIEWTEDHIVSYRKGGVWALRRTSWDVNPTKDIDMYMQEFLSEPSKALGKFAAEPQDSVGGLFSDHESIDEFSNFGNGVDETGAFYESFRPKEDTKYYIHVDLARKHDRCVVSMAHVAGWRTSSMGIQGETELVPVVKVDMIRYWTPDRDNQVNFIEVRDFIVDIHRRGFNIGRVTFDKWESSDMINFFNRMGIKSETLSVGLQHYLDLKIIIAERRGEAPLNEILRRELKQLYITKNGKSVDHPKTSVGSKDISDSVTGAIYGATTLTPKKKAQNIDVRNIDDYRHPEPSQKTPAIINPPRKAPDDIAKFIAIL